MCCAGEVEYLSSEESQGISTEEAGPKPGKMTLDPRMLAVQAMVCKVLLLAC
jgi:hypothetical protein